MIAAVIDIGTNTALLLVASIDSTGGITPLASEQRIPRLGRGVDETRQIQLSSMERTIGVLKQYREIIDGHRPQAVVVCGTSALRDARNGEEFAALVQRVTGFRLEILSGEEESRWTFRGALSGLHGTRSATVVDIGGGSTEVTWGEGDQLEGQVSVDVGAVRLTERFFRHDPPTPEEVRQARIWVETELAKTLSKTSKRGPLIGVAGTATSLALLDQGASEFSVELVANYRLSRSSLERLLGELISLPRVKILSLSRALTGREDIIAAGTLILQEVVTLVGASEVLVSERGLRYGIALREWERISGVRARL